MERKLNKKKIILLVILVVIIILTVVFSILYRKNSKIRYFFDEYIFRKNITENTLPKISNNDYYSFAFNDNLIVFEKNTLNFYSKSASLISSLEIEISEPIFKSKGKYICIAENNGHKVYLIQNQNIVWQCDIDGNITNLTVNKNGYVALSIEDTTHKNICKVFSPSGSELFTTYLSESYIIDLALSNDNKYLALGEANFSGITVQSNIKIISIDDVLSNSDNSIKYNYKADMDSLIVNLDYCNNNLLCVYDNHIGLIKDFSSSEISNFDTSNILYADINNNLIQIEKKNSGFLSYEFELQIINPSSLSKKIYTLDKEPKSIYVSDNIIAINSGTEALFINNNSWLIKHYTSSQEIQSIVLSDDLAGIVFKDKIEFLSL